MLDSIRKWWSYGWSGSYGNGQTLYADGRPIPAFNQPSALGYPAVLRAVTLISNDLARLPMQFEDSYLQGIFDRPNQFISRFELMRQAIFQALVYGNGFILINRKLNGQLGELAPLRIGSVSLDTSDPAGPRYRSTDYGLLRPDQLLHFRALAMDGLWGQSPLTMCSDSVNIGLLTEQSTLNSVNNGQHSDKAVVTHPMNINAAARKAIQAEMVANHSGPANAGKPIVLAENMRIDKMAGSLTPSLNESRRYSVEEVGRVFGIPSAMLGSTQGNAYGSLEWMGNAYKNGCLAHWVSIVASEIELKLGEKPYFDMDAVSRPGVAESFVAMRTAMEAGLLTKNEARAFLDYDPVEGGDEFTQALNLGMGGGTSNAGQDTSEGNSEGDVQ